MSPVHPSTLARKTELASRPVSTPNSTNERDPPPILRTTSAMTPSSPNWEKTGRSQARQGHPTQGGALPFVGGRGAVGRGDVGKRRVDQLAIGAGRASSHAIKLGLGQIAHAA